MSPHSVIFCGTPAFAVPSLASLAEDPHLAVTLVITQPDKPVGRSHTRTPPPVKLFAQQHHLRVFQPENINLELPAYLAQHPDLFPDFLVVVAYGSILKQDILDLPRIAPINVHASLLPRWRGASPIEHSILAGDSETGVSIQIMAAKLDAGPVLASARTPIGARETAIDLRNRLSTLGASLLRETLLQPLSPIPQAEEGITICRKLSREDGHVSLSTHTAEEIDRRIRAFQPWPGVVLQPENVKLLDASLEHHPNAVPLRCKDGTTLFLLTVQPAGKRAMPADAWMRGKRS